METPGSNRALGPTFEVAATTFPRAPNIVSVEAARSDAETSTVVVRYKVSEVGGGRETTPETVRLTRGTMQTIIAGVVCAGL